MTNIWLARDGYPAGLNDRSVDLVDEPAILATRPSTVSGRTQPLMEMKVLIQDGSSRQYYAGTDCWVPAIGMAWDFKNVVTALNVAVREKLGQVNILMYFGNPRYDISLPVATPTASWKPE